MIFKDQLGDEIELSGFPERIVSLVPSQTELLHYLGLGDRVVGITKFCIHPEEWYRSKTRVGGTKTVHIDKVKDLKPDLIIGNKEENQKEDIEALREVAPVWMSDIYNLEDALAMILSIAEITQTQPLGCKLVDQIKADFRDLTRFKNQSVLYVIWHNPTMVAGKNTFIDFALSEIGLNNVVTMDRYPEFNDKANPDYVFLSSEPFPFKEKHIQEYQERYPNAKIVLVDGEIFSWYGSRLLHFKSYINHLLTANT